MRLESVLVTGAAGDIGRGMSQILKDIHFIDKVVGIDINDQFPAHLFYDNFMKCPKVNSGNYLDIIDIIVKKYNIQLIIPTSEPEIRFFNKNKISEISDVKILMPSFNIMDLGFDKYETSKFLQKNGLPFPWTYEVANSQPAEFPCIIKSKDGSGSKAVSIVTEENYLEVKKGKENWIYQELLLPNDEEYTCGIFKSKNSEHLKTIIFKRTLSGGRTGYAEVVENTNISNFLNKVCKYVKFSGSINIQLRLTTKGPMIFEINPRFSSTLTFRHQLGFKDVEWSILDQLGELNQIEFDNKSIIGKKIFRADNEIIY
ncbi:ATP-grasp domain-containing protein [Lysinibacillus sp. G4S2]|uniref:ATP-grasp domain-containing protein n=1 Tax=Lysinibacillus sp. G4S2 TaxID=3055859 RepID=UPI0025A18666|nr:ATP-grasp domain-containing protein [Lysinibacillus sp. G4S2]MDM5246503.1 ATP-grasp domain-containing protein [Lysinibacillus sp. G4S2]